MNHETNTMRPATAVINRDNLIYNYRLLEKRAGEANVMAVVKANAYGHGLDLIAPALFDAGCRHFAVTDAEEGVRARKLLPDAESIVLLSGIFDAADAGLVSTHSLTPLLIDEQQVRLLTDAGFEGSVWIKINTGMQRLGAENPATLIAACKNREIGITGILSHLACADAPEHPLNQTQCEEFSLLHKQLAPESNASLLNSAGMVSMPDHTFDFVRPGIALYGVEPIPDEPLGLKPVMQFSAEVMQIHRVAKGCGISYGASYTAPTDMSVAVVSLGYGDGLPRLLSNRGHAAFGEHSLPIVGRVCMDFCLLDCSDSPAKAGDIVEFWGEHIPAGGVAESIGTIAYELFTGVNERVRRRSL